MIVNFARYKTIEESKRFVNDKLETVLENGGKIVKRVKTSEGEQVIFNEQGKVGEIIDCSGGFCIAIFSSDPKHIVGYYGKFYEKK